MMRGVWEYPEVIAVSEGNGARRAGNPGHGK